MIFVPAFASIVFAARIATDYDHSVNFERYKTYSWIQTKAGNSLWEDRIMQDVDSQLAGRGWTRVDSGGDISVAAFGSTHDQRTLETFYNGFGGGWRWRGLGDGIATTTVDVTKVGTLVIDLFDSQTKKLVWRGSASGTLSGKPDKNEKKLEKSVADMFKHFPPAPHN